LREQIATEKPCRTVETAKLDFHGSARLRNIAPRFPSCGVHQGCDEILAAGRLSIANSKESPQPRIRADDRAIARDHDRRHHGAGFENREVEASRSRGIHPTHWLRHQLVSGNTVGTRPRVSVSTG
jgi:hypothetical protein